MGNVGMDMAYHRSSVRDLTIAPFIVTPSAAPNLIRSGWLYILDLLTKLLDACASEEGDSEGMGHAPLPPQLTRAVRV